MIIPPKLKPGDGVRVISPARSLGIISQECRGNANKRFKDFGLKLSFGKPAAEKDEFMSSSIESRIEDIHEAFRDSSIKLVITTIGGFNSNQLLSYLDYDLIKNNPKILCGYSDITALANAIYAKTGLMTYSGPHYSSFGEKLYFDYTSEYFKKCLFFDGPFEVLASEEWSDDLWYQDQLNRNLIKNKGHKLINQGEAVGTIVGANIGTFNLLQGTEYFPSLENSILFAEDDVESLPHTFDRDLQSLIHLPGFEGVKGVVIGRFQKASQMTDEKLTKIIKTKRELNKIPVIADVDFGHTNPKITFPIGGAARLAAKKEGIKLEIIKH